jgi:hypothetical protein
MWHHLRISEQQDLSDKDRLPGVVVRVPGYRSGGPGSISKATGFSER